MEGEREAGREWGRGLGMEEEREGCRKGGRVRMEEEREEGDAFKGCLRPETWMLLQDVGSISKAP